MASVNKIRIEYLDNPIGLGIASPRITWSLEGCEKQLGGSLVYSVNGGEAKSLPVNDASMHLDFQEAFESRDRVCFHLLIETEQGQVESEEHFFEIGLLKQTDWTSQWISGNYKPSKKVRYPVDCFEKSFSLSSIKKARLYITALGLYEASLNGERVGAFVLAPGSTDYRKRVQYQTYDVTSLLRDGDNSLSILLADGWYRGSIGAKGFTCVFGKQTAVRAQLEIEHEGGTKETIGTDSSFRWSNDGPIRFADLKDGEIVDASLEPTYSGHAIEVTKEANIQASNNTFVEERETFQPKAIATSPSGKTIYEFQQNLAGIIDFKVNAHQGDRVDIVLGEMLDSEGEVTLKNVQCIRKGKRTPLQEIHFICKEGENHYHGRFSIAGFRYASVSSPVALSEITQIALYTTFEETSSFSCSNPLINTFVRNTLWSLKGNSADVPTDCPTRERMGWTGDSQVFFNTAAFLTNYAPFASKHLVDVFDRQDKSGRLPQIAPYNAEDWFMDTMNGSVGWADVGVLMPWRFYERYGDIRILERYYDDMMRYARFMIRRCGRPKGIYTLYAKPLHLSKENRRFGVNTGQSYGEWAEPNDVKAVVWTDFAEPHPEESMAYTSYILGLMSKIAELLGKTEDIPELLEYSLGVKKAYQELVTKPKFTLDTDRQAKLVRPLYMRLLTEEQETFAKKRLIEALDHYRWRLGTGFLSTPFILSVLSEIDHEAAYRLLENEEMPGWLFMSIHDTGTIWEGWEGPESQLGISSLNHYSKGAMVEWLISGMCGINVDGENHFSIQPVVGGKETFAEASYQSIYGTISSKWERKDGKTVFEISVPANTTADFSYRDVTKHLAPGHHIIEA